MKTVLITGTSSGIGYATSCLLLDRGYTVIGITRTKAMLENGNYIEYLCDLKDTESYLPAIKDILSKYTVDVLINNAGCAYYGLFENIPPARLHEMIAVNLEAPMVITGQFLPSFKKNGGTVINISSMTAKSSTNTHGVAYGATKAALTSFGTSLFAEARKHGVKVVNIHPEMTDTDLYRNADFMADDTPMCALTPEDVASQIIYCIEAPEDLNIGDISITPQLHRIKKKEAPHD